MNRIASNLARLRDDIATIARSVRRDSAEIKLVAVSKTHPIAVLEAAVQAGQHVFGENTIQEALPKIAHFARRDFMEDAVASPTRRPAPINAEALEWHFIGHLQSNKAKFIPRHFSWIHSLDNHRLGQRLSRLAQDAGAVVNALIEVNLTRDPRKHGVAPQAVVPLLEELLRETLPGIRLRGLMAIGPYPADPATIRRAYAELRALRDRCAERFDLKAFDQLSIGMSGDYAEAIREGATLLRIGTAIFGEREYGRPADLP